MKSEAVLLSGVRKNRAVLALSGLALVGCLGLVSCGKKESDAGASASKRSESVAGSSFPGSATRGASNKPLTSEDSVNMQAAFMMGLQERLAGRPGQAEGFFLEVMRLDGGNAAAAYELARLYAQRNEVGRATTLARLASERDPKNGWYQRLYADLAERDGQTNEAIKALERLVAAEPRKLDGYEGLVAAQLKALKPDDALKTLNRAEQVLGAIPGLILQRQQIYLNMGNQKAARAELGKLTAADPDNLDYKLYEIQAMLEANDTALARRTINTARERNPDDPRLKGASLELSRMGKNPKQYIADLKQVMGAPELEVDTKVKLMGQFLEDARTRKEFPTIADSAVAIAAIFTKTHPNNPKPWSMLADLQLATGQAKAAHYSFGQAIGLDALNGGEPKFILFQQRMAAAAQAQLYDTLLADANDALELFPNQAIVYLFRGIAQQGKRQFAQAANTLNTGLGLAEGNDNLIAELQGQLGEAYHALNRHPESDAAFEAALEIDPKKLGVLNNYAYYLAVRGEKLARAEELAKRINSLTPNNPGVMDTYAWVKYRQGDFEGARKLLQDAYNAGGQTNPTIVEHLGDALAKLGRLNEAAEMWKRAQALPGGGSALLERKIKEQKLYE